MKKGMPGWLTAVLGLLLLALAAGMLLPSRPQAPDLRPSVADIPYEDFHAAPPVVTPDAGAIPPAGEGRHPHGVALIVDDMGYDLQALRRILALDVPVAIAILPDAPHPERSAEMARDAGQMVMLHLPMEPDTEKYRRRMSDAFLKQGMDKATMRGVLLRDLARVPYVEGVNNHMGSRLTRMEAQMEWLMQLLDEEGLFFVDSRTSARSVAAAKAAEAGLPWASRQIFLDHRLDEAYMQHAWDQALACQSGRRACIVIAHPHPETIDFLERKLAESGRLTLTPLRGLLHPSRRLVARSGS